MNVIEQSIDCSSYDGPGAFQVVAFEIDPKADADLVHEAMKAAREQGGTSLDPSGGVRASSTLIKTRYLGALSELVLAQYLQDRLGQSCQVHREPFHDYSSHVDLKVSKNESTVELEVRGSFPYSPLERVICKLFDIIGPYSASYKLGEEAKDIYLRTLINESVQNFSVERRHTLWFVGGAERDLFERIGHDSDLKQRGARYRLIKPISLARDVPAVL
ncbi:MAG: hypothetical protein ACK41D_07155 [Rubricoccaceae bacterium]